MQLLSLTKLTAFHADLSQRLNCSLPVASNSFVLLPDAPNLCVASMSTACR